MLCKLQQYEQMMTSVTWNQESQNIQEKKVKKEKNRKERKIQFNNKSNEGVKMSTSEDNCRKKG